MNATHDRIRELLARYDAAESTLAEERELRRLLAEPTAAAAFPAAAKLLAVWPLLAATSAPPAAEAPWREESAPSAPARATSTPAAPRRLTPRRPVLRRPFTYAVAAAVAFFLAAAIGIALELGRGGRAPALAEATPTTIDWSRYEVTDPAEAGRITGAALRNISTRLERGTRIASREVSRIEPIHHATSN